MIRLKKIKIIGFKDPSIEKELEFSTEPISVIYGENGSGKTTLLKILFAVFSKDEQTLLMERVKQIFIDYEKDNSIKTLNVKRNDVINFNNKDFDWGDISDIYESSSIFFGVHRGGVNQENKSETHELVQFERDYLGNIISITANTPESKIFKNKIKESDENKFLLSISKPHLSTDFVSINDIQNAIVSQFQKGQDIVSENIKKAFYETIEKAMDIETGQDFQLPADFESRIKDKKDFILKAIPKENSSLTERIKNYLNTGNSLLTEKSKIFRALLLNILKSAEDPNPTLESVTSLIKIFNEHLYKEKKIIVDLNEAYIDIGNNKFHSLQDLSSGERNLLSLLTLFLVIGKDRNFLLIDEPEISLNIKWQRDFLPLLSRLNSNAQIIVASHSPSIAHKNSKYLVELK